MNLKEGAITKRFMALTYTRRIPKVWF